MDILIIKPSSLGDIIHGLQFAESLRRGIDNARINWVSREMFAPLVQSCHTVDHTHVFHRKGSLGGFIRLIREIRQTHYDWVLDLQGLFRSGALCRFARADNKAGRSDAREGAGWFYQTRVPLPSLGQAHALEILMEFQRLFDLEPAEPPPLKFDDKLSDDNRGALGQAQGKRVLIFPESRREEKEWPHFDELTRTLLGQVPELQLVRVATSGAEPGNAEPDRLVNLSGCTAIEELPALIDSADLIVANDSGPMHLAAAMHKPVVALFGPTDPKRFGPWGQMENVLSAPDADLSRLPATQVADFILQKLG
ncbi:MAG: glycosyltransferase family 9 protein [Verrucomicrobiota bacterium]|nr:glycosyltransferase family 9 protein [Verrucomicrobiota bacterium]